MGFLDKLRRRSSSASDEGLKPGEQIEHAECLHVTLAPQWDEAADIGIEAKAAHFNCATCGSSFTPEATAELRATRAARIAAE